MIAAVIQGLTVSAGGGIYGIIMHVIATGTFVLVAGNIYRYKKTRGGGPHRAGLRRSVHGRHHGGRQPDHHPLLPVESVKAMLIPIVIPFNLIKAGINGAVTFVLYKTVSRFIKGEKKTGKAVPDSVN